VALTTLLTLTPAPHLTHTYGRKESKKRGFNFAAASFSLLFLWGPNN